ncbi:GAF domain-containing protein [Marisediminicola senii]|uniref:GAF domain-containing protein n=1 Tax=Marisediminicola senii TaxID=2711233 RepID=UPI0013EB2D3C|nr:GAF domain-containing protein [Marisediminicola senii]
MRLTRLRWTDLVAPVISWRLTAADQRMSSIPRPVDAPVGHVGGFDSDRIVILGAGPAAGWGVTTHDLALPGSLARALTARTGRGSDIRLIANPEMCAGNAAQALDGFNLSRYDAVVIILGVNDSTRLTPVQRWRDDVTELIEKVGRSAPHEVKIVVTGVQPIRSIPVFDSVTGAIADAHADVLNRETEQLCGVTGSATFVPLTVLPPTDDSEERYRAPTQYAHWADQIADVLAPLLESQQRLNGDRRRGGRVATPSEETAREKAVDELRLPGYGTDERLNHIVSLARQAFNADGALITVLKSEMQMHLAEVGMNLAELPRAQSFCHFVVESGEAMIVRDTHDDDRFRHNPLVTDGPRIRFYAGFPIQAPSGELIGALCVLDDHPRRRADDINVDVLQELATFVEKELWQYLGRPA